MTTFECCRTKSFPNSYYICISCVRVFHRSCVLRDKSKFTLIGGHKIKCCDNLETEHLLNEKSLLEETISELNENSFLREQHLKRLKEDHRKFIEEVTTRENELNALIKNQEEIIINAQEELAKLKKEIKLLSTKKLVTTNSTQTMANTLVTRSTETENMTNIKHHFTNKDIQTKPSRRTTVSGQQEDDDNTVKTEEKKKVLIIGDEYARKIASTLHFISGSEYSVKGLVFPNSRFFDICKGIFEKTVHFNENDFIILMFKTNCIDNRRSLLMSLKYLLPVSKTSNLIILSKCSEYRDEIINTLISTEIRTFVDTNKNSSIYFHTHVDKPASVISKKLKYLSQYSRKRSPVLKTLNTMEIISNNELRLFRR